MHKNSRQSLVTSPQSVSIRATVFSCGRLVYNLRMNTRTTYRFVPSPTNCIHFVRSLWLTNQRFTRLIRVTYPPKILDFTSVSRVLYTLPTALTTRTTFI